jgi:hypothetical protein
METNWTMQRYWDSTSNEEGTNCWRWVGSGSAWDRSYFQLGGRSWAANWVPWVLVAGDGVQSVNPACQTADCVNPEHQEVVLHGLDEISVRRSIEAITQCWAGHPFAGSNYAVVDRLQEGIYAHFCRTCSKSE